MLIFVEGGKPENPEKNPRSRDENQQQTQPTYDAGSGNWTQATAVEGERSHHCAIPAPQIRYLNRRIQCSDNRGKGTLVSVEVFRKLLCVQSPQSWSGRAQKRGWNVLLPSADFSRLPVREEDYVTSSQRVLLPLVTRHWIIELDNAFR